MQNVQEAKLNDMLHAFYDIIDNSIVKDGLAIVESTTTKRVAIVLMAETERYR